MGLREKQTHILPVHGVARITNGRRSYFLRLHIRKSCRMRNNYNNIYSKIDLKLKYQNRKLRLRKLKRKGINSVPTDEQLICAGMKPSENLKVDYRILCRESQVGLYVIQNGCFCYVNDSLAHILGYDKVEELVGRPFWDIVHPDDYQRVSLRSHLQTSGAVLPSREKRYGFRAVKKGGEMIWVRMCGKNARYLGKRANLGYLEDVTYLRNLKKSTEKYRAIIDQVEDAVGEVDLKGNVLFFNESGCKIWGVNREQILGKNFRSYLEEDAIDIVKKAYNKVYRTGVPGKNIVYEIIRGDGQRRLVEDSVALIRDHDGKVTGFRAVSRDIGERVAAEKRLTEQRVRLEAIFRSVKDAIITVDPQQRVIEANASTENICGIKVEDIVGKKFPYCLNSCSRSCKEVLEQTLNRKSSTREFQMECGLEKRHHQIVSVSSSPLLDPDGNFMGAVLVIRDITLIQDLEKELFTRNKYQNIIGKSKKMQEIYGLIEKLSDLQTTVLVTGQSGTGKELIARALHYSGIRAFKPFITVNCSALSENLLESELFGHVRGAFTGAIENKQGRFLAADGGTILLDEIGDISPMIQLKLLRVLQEKEVERVGDIKPQKIDVRVIACTNADLIEKVKSGEFREDLYYRLKVVEISLPRLRERIEDVPLLLEHFCKIFGKKFKKKINGVSNDVLAKFMDYHWPGNVRELEHVIERAFVLCQGSMISMQHLPAEIREKSETIDVVNSSEKDNGISQQGQAILDALKRARWNKSKAAELLGVSRQTLYRKIDKYNILEYEEIN